ncbi:NADH-quinone oxidoreductase subunit J [Buchnera aphidicola (Phyllaphis fagi)]|uniref:NADH-quinone oxidoreductase subunit J family protein n=1 Tax=Buchnera aphidicola TaxID=9 RepID=UPI0034644E6F
MELVFYFFLFLTLIFTILCVFQKNVIYSLFYLSASILSTSSIFFLLGSYFIGSLQIIIYAGAIIVLFVFSIMMFNLDEQIKKKKNNFLYWVYPIILFCIFLLLIWKKLLYFKNKYIIRSEINLKVLGINLFGPYIFVVEFSSILLLSALIIVLIITNDQKIKKISLLKNKNKD